MRLINRILIVLILLSSNFNFSQEFNGYKYIVVNNLDYGAQGKDIYGISHSVFNYFQRKGYIVFLGWNESLVPNDLRFNLCLGLEVNISHKGDRPYEVSLDFRNCKNNAYKHLTGTASTNFNDALGSVFNQLDQIKYYYFDKDKLLTLDFPIVENINKDEAELKIYFDKTKLDPIEGIYKSYKSDPNYKLGIFKVGDKYKAIIIESDLPQWKKGDVKAVFESTAVEGVFSVKYYMSDKTPLETFANLEGGLINVELKGPNGINQDLKLLKLYPKK